MLGDEKLIGEQSEFLNFILLGYQTYLIAINGTWNCDGLIELISLFVLISNDLWRCECVSSPATSIHGIQ